MNGRRARLFSLAALSLVTLSTLCLARFTSTAQQTASPNLFAGDPALNELAQYRQWTRVNEKPFDVSSISLAPGEIRVVEGVNFPAV